MKTFCPACERPGWRQDVESDESLSASEKDYILNWRDPITDFSDGTQYPQVCGEKHPRR